MKAVKRYVMVFNDENFYAIAQLIIAVTTREEEIHAFSNPSGFLIVNTASTRRRITFM
jgi:hypothetical protein